MDPQDYNAGKTVTGRKRCDFERYARTVAAFIRRNDPHHAPSLDQTDKLSLNHTSWIGSQAAPVICRCRGSRRG